MKQLTEKAARHKLSGTGNWQSAIRNIQHLKSRNKKGAEMITAPNIICLLHIADCKLTTLRHQRSSPLLSFATAHILPYCRRSCSQTREDRYLQGSGDL